MWYESWPRFVCVCVMYTINIETQVGDIEKLVKNSEIPIFIMYGVCGEHQWDIK